ncbi:MAG TPA: cytochrome c3 family protein [Planctomycetota bacterium]|nr:cytochrome c3 family protein [Planctomycetota bacterium]
MPQLFHPSINSFAKASAVGIVVGIAMLILAATSVDRSPYVTRIGEPLPQPVPFSHQHHAGALKIDCRYCHTSVETSSFAGLPSLETCMSCHSQIWRDSPMLSVVRESYSTGRALSWNRVHHLPDYAYFRHDIHLAKGVACENCHGRVDEMPLMWKANTLHMDWCLDCHRNSERYLRPKDRVFEMGYVPNEPQQTLGVKLLKENQVEPQRITDCVTCHR